MNDDPLRAIAIDLRASKMFNTLIGDFYCSACCAVVAGIQPVALLKLHGVRFLHQRIGNEANRP